MSGRLRHIFRLRKATLSGSAKAALLAVAPLLLTTPAAAAPVHDVPKPPGHVDLTPRGYKPKPMPVFSPRKSARASARKDVLSDGDPTYIPSTAPTGAVTPPLDEMKRAHVSSFQEQRYQYSTTLHPARPVAKYFFVDAAGKSSWCTATVVNAQNMSMAVTAAHCVYDAGAGGWNRSGFICPGYDAGTCKLGAWPVRLHVTHTQWINGSKAYDYDSAFILLGTDRFSQVERRVRQKRNCSERRTRRARKRCRRKERRNPRYSTVTERVAESAATVQSVSGSQGIAWDAAVPSEVWAFGYPATDPRWPDVAYDDRYLTWCPRRQAVWVEAHLSLLIACGMTGGSSGGPWLISPNSAWGAYVNSVNSHKAFVENGTLYGYGPYFAGSAEGSLYQTYQVR